jgi:hypothetical protein
MLSFVEKKSMGRNQNQSDYRPSYDGGNRQKRTTTISLYDDFCHLTTGKQTASKLQRFDTALTASSKQTFEKSILGSIINTPGVHGRDVTTGDKKPVMRIPSINARSIFCFFGPFSSAHDGMLEQCTSRRITIRQVWLLSKFVRINNVRVPQCHANLRFWFSLLPPFIAGFRLTLTSRTYKQHINFKKKHPVG